MKEITSTALTFLKHNLRGKMQHLAGTENHHQISNSFLLVIGQRDLCKKKKKERKSDVKVDIFSVAPGLVFLKVMNYPHHFWPLQGILRSIVKLVKQGNF